MVRDGYLTRDLHVDFEQRGEVTVEKRIGTTLSRLWSQGG
jgi:hypothetical protein